VIVLGLIPARSGSRGIPRKNERTLAGRTLVERAVDVAHASGVIDRIVLTTDSELIGAIGLRAGIDVILRPAELAGDDTPMVSVIEHALTELEHADWRCDVIALLQPTQPLRRPEHIREALRILEETGASSVAGVVAIPPHYAPQYAMRLDHDHLVPYVPEGAVLTRRQDVEPAYSRDGTIYLFRRETIRGGDSPSDWERAEEILAR
jgi:CMP-N-acetylneuraminic acid synthetase